MNTDRILKTKTINWKLKVLRDVNFDGQTDGGTEHFVIPDLPEHTTTCDPSGPKIRNSVLYSDFHFYLIK